jgi:hypothetical protein
MPLLTPFPRRITSVQGGILAPQFTNPPSPFALATYSWLLAAKHFSARTKTEGYRPILVAHAVDLDRFFSTRDVLDQDVELEIADLTKGGMSTITRSLSETDDTSRLGQASLTLMNEHNLWQGLAGRIDNSVLQLYLGFLELAFAQYLPIFRGVVDRHAVGYKAQLALADTSIQESVNLSIPVSDYFPGAPQDSQGKTIPLVVGTIADAPLIPVIQGPASSPLAQAMTDSDTSLLLSTYGALFPSSGDLVIATTAATATLGSGANGTVTLTARTPGTSGNVLTVELVGTLTWAQYVIVRQTGDAIQVWLTLVAGENTATKVAAALSRLPSVSAVASGDGSTALTGTEGPTAFTGGVDGETLSYASRRLTTLADGTTVLALEGLVRAAPLAHAAGVLIARTNLEQTTHLLGLGTLVVLSVRDQGVDVPSDQYELIIDTTHTQVVTLLRLPYVPTRLTATMQAQNVQLTDLITNGGLETGDDTGHTTEDATLDIESTDPDPFKGSYYGALTGQEGSYGRDYQDLATVPGASYTWKVSYRDRNAPSLASNPGFEDDLTDWNQRDVSLAEAVTDDPFPTPAEGSQVATVRPLPPFSAYSLPNGDFEAGALTNWSTSTTYWGPATFTVQSSSVHSGTYALRIDVPPNTGQGLYSNSGTLVRAITVPLGKAVRLRFAYKNTAGAHANDIAPLLPGGPSLPGQGPQARRDGNNGALIVSLSVPPLFGYPDYNGSVYISQAFPISTSWTTAYLDIPTTVSTTLYLVFQVFMSFHSLPTDTTYPVYLDDVTIGEVGPVPAYALTEYQDIAVTSGQPYTLAFNYLTGRDLVSTPSGTATRVSNLTYALGTPSAEESYVAATSVGQAHQYTNGVATDGDGQSMALLPWVSFVPTDTTLRLRFVFTGQVTPLSGGIPPRDARQRYVSPFLAALDAVQLTEGVGPNQTATALQIGTPVAPGALLDLALDHVTTWTTVTGSFIATATTTRASLLSQYSVDALASLFDEWHVTQALVAGQAAGANPMDAILYVAQRFLPSVVPNMAAFATARARLLAWQFGALITNPGDSEQLLQRMARQCKSLLTRDALGRLTPLVLDRSRPVLQQFDILNIVGEMIQEPGPTDSIFTEFHVYFGTATGGSTTPADFAGQVFASPTDTNVSGLLGTQLIARCAHALTATQRAHRWDYFAEWIQDLTTATLFLDWLTQRHTTRDERANLTTWLDAAALQEGNLVTLEHFQLPNNGAKVVAEIVDWRLNPGRLSAGMQLVARVLGPAAVPAPVATDVVLATDDATPITTDLTLAVTPHAGADLDPSSVDLDQTLAGHQVSYVVPLLGTFTVDALGVVTFTPLTGADADAVASYTMADTFGTPSNVASITVTVTPAPAPPYTRPLDIQNGTSAWGLYQLRTAYSGPLLKVRRSSDDTTQDIGFDSGTGALDTAALLAFCGAGDGFVDTAYDQTGNGRNFTQATTANQPKIVSSGAMVTGVGGLPALLFDALNDNLVGATVGTLFTAAEGTAFVVWNAIDSTGGSTQTYDSPALFEDVTNGTVWLTTSKPSGLYKLNAGNWDGNEDHAQVGFSIATDYVAVWQHTGGTIYNYLNSPTAGASAASGTSTPTTANIRHGLNYNGNARYNGYIAGAIFYNASVSSGNLDAIGAALAALYGISWA